MNREQKHQYDYAVGLTRIAAITISNARLNLDTLYKNGVKLDELQAASAYMALDEVEEAIDAARQWFHDHHGIDLAGQPPLHEVTEYDLIGPDEIPDWLSKFRRDMKAGQNKGLQVPKNTLAMSILWLREVIDTATDFEEDLHRWLQNMDEQQTKEERTMNDDVTNLYDPLIGEQQ